MNPLNHIKITNFKGGNESLVINSFVGMKDSWWLKSKGFGQKMQIEINIHVHLRL